MENNENLKIEYKIITIGDSGVGKTSILKRYIHSKFEEENMSTIGFSLAFKELTLKNNSKISLKLIDTAGQEKYRALTKSYYKNADGAIFVFAHDDEKSFEHIENWKQIFEENIDSTKIPIFLIGNKNDQPTFNKEDSFEDFIKKHNILKYISTSAKDNINIDIIFEEMAEIINSTHRKKSIKQTIKKLKINKRSECRSCKRFLIK